MKRKYIYKIFAFFVTASIIFASCTKETAEVRLDPTLSTSQTLNVTSSTATVVGFVVAEGAGFTEKGVCYSTAETPTIADSKVAYTNASNTKATYNVVLTGLDYATKYYARAYATGTADTIYGEEVSFTTLPVVPTLTTDAITEITGNSATGGGNVTIAGGATVTARGICFGMDHNPTVADSKTADGDGLGAFVSALTELKGNTVYYARAYATNSAGTGYGPEVTFTTLVDLPAVTTASVTEITKISAVSGGDVTYDGGAEITARGLVWSTSANPTILNNLIDGGTGTGAFVSELTELTLNTTYHVRAFATNSAGTSYGEDIQFNTLADITKLWVVGSYNGWDNSDNAMYIESTATNNGDAEGYVDLTGTEFKLTTDHSWSDPATFGDDGSGNLTNPGSNIVVPSVGYYLIKANIGTMTYSTTLTTWGVMGDYNGWSSQTDMNYNPTTKIFTLALSMTSGQTFKFRGTSDWSINYGSDAADGTLNAGGANIAVDTDADYALTMDLSHPNAYTYSAHRWGVVGGATPDPTWGSDFNMTWDATNSVFTITLDLTVGEFKFRADDGWDVNYGGDLNALVPGGANLVIDTAGNYTITFDPWGLTATVTLN